MLLGWFYYTIFYASGLVWFDLTYFGIFFSVGGVGVVLSFGYFFFLHWVLIPLGSFSFIYSSVGFDFNGSVIFIHFGGVGVVYYLVIFSSISWNHYTILIVLLCWLPFIDFVGSFSFTGFGFFILIEGVGGCFIFSLLGLVPYTHLYFSAMGSNLKVLSF